MCTCTQESTVRGHQQGVHLTGTTSCDIHLHCLMWIYVYSDSTSSKLLALNGSTNVFITLYTNVYVTRCLVTSYRCVCD